MFSKTAFAFLVCIACFLIGAVYIVAQPEDISDKQEQPAEPAAAPEAAPEEAPAVAACELTYENFGKKFLETYCLRCHSSAQEGMFKRGFAPKGSDFDVLEIVTKEGGEIVEYVADKKKMPKGKPKPTDEEREKVRQWIECEYAEAK